MGVSLYDSGYGFYRTLVAQHEQCHDNHGGRDFYKYNRAINLRLERGGG
jgi:hypothetical protein